MDGITVNGYANSATGSLLCLYLVLEAIQQVAVGGCLIDSTAAPSRQLQLGFRAVW